MSDQDQQCLIDLSQGDSHRLLNGVEILEEYLVVQDISLIDLRAMQDILGQVMASFKIKVVMLFMIKFLLFINRYVVLVLYWMARMIKGGYDPYIARHLLAIAT